MHFLWIFWIVQIDVGAATHFFRLVRLLEQMFMIILLCPKNKPYIGTLKL